MLYLELILLGISLSVDAFSLALTIGLNKDFVKKIKTYSLTVGIFHFIMPILGYIIRQLINQVLYLPNKEIFIIVLVFILLGVIINKNESSKVLNQFSFGLSVSIDSFTIGVTLTRNYIIISSIIFSITSSLFTFLGFIFARKIKEKIKSNTKIISILIISILIIYNIFK